MTVGYLRPDVADMVLRVLDRSVHPELFETLCQVTISVGRNQELRPCHRIQDSRESYHGSRNKQVLTTAAPGTYGGPPINRLSNAHL